MVAKTDVGRVRFKNHRQSPGPDPGLFTHVGPFGWGGEPTTASQDESGVTIGLVGAPGPQRFLAKLGRSRIKTRPHHITANPCLP